MKRIVGLSAFLLCLNGCHMMSSLFHKPKPIETKTTEIDEQNLQRDQRFAKFEHVTIDGTANIKFEQSRDYQIRTLGEKSDVRKVQVTQNGKNIRIYIPGSVEDDDLIPEILIRAPHIDHVVYDGDGTIGSRGRGAMVVEQIDLHTNSATQINGMAGLHFLNFYGNGKLRINDLKTEFLKIRAHDRSAIDIHGKIGLRQIDMEGSGWMRVHWVDSTFLRVNMTDNAYVQLAGLVDTLELNLMSNSYFNGRQLRTEKAYSRTYANARADVYVKQMQTNLTKGYSNVYNYYDADITTSFMADSSSVLRMMDIQ